MANFQTAEQQTDWKNVRTGSNTEAGSKMLSAKLHSLVKEFTKNGKKKNQCTSLAQY